LINKTWLITGGTGSFGKEAVKTVLNEYQPKKVIVFSRDELKQYEMANDLNDERDRMRYFIGDIRDLGRLRMALEDVNICIHAAALKQVPAAEYNPFECVKTNIMGSQNVIQACIDNGVEKVMALSTDKAVHPVNLYGKTKAVMENLFVAGNHYAKHTTFSVTRYGNVEGSRGSVIPLFREQAKTGTLYITHPDMTRFWITLTEGVHFVLYALSKMTGGEIFVPKLRSRRIEDIARDIAPECNIEYIGIRPGEKIHETLIAKEEAYRTVEYDNNYVIHPSISYFKYSAGRGKPIDIDFEYTSRI
jgi:UDP-N-acetylglucosamine 4,6-dehydratase